MTILLDNTVLSNYSTIRRPELIRLAFVEEVGTTEIAFEEMCAGVSIGRLVECDWGWLTRFPLTPAEQPQFTALVSHLGQGEASCLAVALRRGFRVATDDRDARRLARQMSIPLTGTIGILAVLVKQQKVALREGNRLLRLMITAGYRTPVETLEEIIDKLD